MSWRTAKCETISYQVKKGIRDGDNPKVIFLRKMMGCQFWVWFYNS